MLLRRPMWLFGVTAMSYGASLALVLTVMPYYLFRSGVSIEHIGWYGFASQLPLLLQVFYAPLIEIGLRRKSWFFLLTCLSATFMSIGLLCQLPARLNTFLICMFIGQLFSSLLPSCYGGLASTTLDEGERDRAASLFNVGSLGGGALGASVLLELAQHGAIAGAAFTFAAMRILCATAVLAIPESVPPRRSLRELGRELLNELAVLTRSRDAWQGMLMCMLPTSAMALTFFLPALAADYQATPRTITIANGSVGWAITGLGSFVGGLACTRWNRRWVFVFGSLLMAAADFVFLALPLRPSGYVTGALVYSFFSGALLTAWAAVVFDLISKASRSASTQFNLFSGAVALSTMYMAFLDGRVHAQFGLRALYGFDGLATLLAALVVLGMLALRRAD